MAASGVVGQERDVRVWSPSNAKLDNAPFRKSYKACQRHQEGRPDGSVHATGGWPATRHPGHDDLQWKRNGNHPGATEDYKLVAADRGKNLTVTATPNSTATRPVPPPVRHKIK